MAKAKPPAAPDTSKADTAATEGRSPASEQTQEQADAGETHTQDPQPPGPNAAEPAAPESGAVEVGRDPQPGLRVTAAREGFRRAGRAWSKQPTEIPLADLSDDQVAALMAEPLLTVEEIVLP